MVDEIKTVKKFGWVPEFPDIRDNNYLLAKMPKAATRSNIEIENPADRIAEAVARVLPPEDQGNTGSCVGWATGTVYSFVHNVARRSALQIYYEARRLLGPQYLRVDTGSHIRDAMKYVSNYGAGRDSFWPNVETKFDEDPPEFVDRDALKRKKNTYIPITTPEEFRRCIMDEAFPFEIGFSVYGNFQNQLTYRYGIVNMPSGSMLGGHAVTVMPGGYIDNFHAHPAAQAALASGVPLSGLPTRVYHCRNSWGVDWGYSGDFFIAADYLENPSLADDGWTLRLPITI